jgi:hypothetical protein
MYIVDLHDPKVQTTIETISDVVKFNFGTFFGVFVTSLPIVSLLLSM